MAKKFHVNLKGEVGPCEARKRPCSFGGDESHAATEEEARQKYEKLMEASSKPELLYKTPRTRKNGFTPVPNPELAEAMRQIGQSSATSPYDPRPNRERTRKDAKRAAIRSQLDS